MLDGNRPTIETACITTIAGTTEVAGTEIACTGTEGKN